MCVGVVGKRDQLTFLRAQRRRTPVLWALLLVFLVALPWVIEGLDSIELHHFEDRQRQILENRYNSGIVLVEVDNVSQNDQTIRSLFGRYPWRREIYAYLLRFSQRAQSKAVLMEASFTGGADIDHPESDQAFIDAISPKVPVITSLSEASKVDLAPFESASEREAMFEALSREWRNIEGPPIVDVHFYDAFEVPFERIVRSPAYFYPLDDLVFDANGKVRQVVLFGRGKIRNGIPTWPVAPFVLNPSAKVVTTPQGELILGTHKVHLRGEANPIINWYGNVSKSGQKIYPRYSLSHVVKSQMAWECRQNPKLSVCHRFDYKNTPLLDPVIFHQRYVLVGYNSSWFDSHTYSTLYDRENHSQKYPNLFIQANILDNLIHDDFIGRPGWRIPIPWGQGKSVSLVTGLICFLLFVSTYILANRIRSVLFSLFWVIVLGGVYSWLTVFAYHHWNLWLNWAYPIASMGVTYVSTYLYRFTQAEKRKHQLRMAFAKYMSPTSMAYIEKHMDSTQLRSQKRQLTYLFCDIRGFTTFAEQNPPARVQAVLTEYFTQMNAVILHDYRGVINKLIGDAILAYWGFPIESKNDAVMAVSAALEMKALNQAWLDDPTKPPLRIGIGINTGEGMVGDIGSQDFMDFTVIGDSVNTAARLEKLNKTFGTTIIISKATYDLVKDHIEARYLGTVELPGKSQRVEVYEPLTLKAPIPTKVGKTVLVGNPSTADSFH